jgi:hypothetical protein
MKLKDLITEDWADDVWAMNIPELNSLPEQMQWDSIKKNPLAIWNIKHPTRAMQKYAIEKKPTVVNAIKVGVHFDDDMILLALSLNGFVISGIENPTEEMQLAAIQNHIGTLSGIANPTPKVIKLALTSPHNFDHDSIYESFKHEVKRLFKDNALLMKKWLRYGETMRNQQ